MTDPKYHRPRAENAPIGWLSRRGNGCAMAARKIADLLIEHAAVLVAVADTGEVYAIDPCGRRADEVCSKRQGWIVGIYTADSTRAMILDDLRERAGELRRDAA
jgi:hypothetical protein